MSTSSYSLIEKLLEFQNTFINLVHSEILTFSEPQQKKQALLKFQILRMSDKNELFNEMITILRKQLIEQKQQADSVLKSYFTKILDLDYLPFLHINRYELTKLSIFGFDIYIDPLQAILQILNRLERVFYILEESLKQHSEEYLMLKQKGSWQTLLSGWTNYYIYLNFYKLSLNIYMLKQYIQTADTSLFKKDKEIVFTGVYNFYKKLVPRLIQMNQVQFLEELADLNNTMYSFHGSFDYFMFFTCLRPEKRFIKVYDRIKDLERKCKTTNILTPLLFGILNNFRYFNLFVEQVQDREYIHLLRVLLSGLIINFKLRILEYDQVLELIEKVIIKLNLLKGMNFKIISGDLGPQWREAKDFFISAFKSGYNIGEIQTWNLCETERIQPRIRSFLIEGTLLLQNCKYDDFIKTLQKQELEEILINQISQLTSSNQSLSSLSNNWKKIKIDETQSVDSKCLNIIRIVNLMSILENFSEKLLYSVCSSMIEINSKSPLLMSVLGETAETINSMVTIINRKEPISNLKYILPDFHKKNIPQNTFEDIVPVYLHCFIIKQSLQNLIGVIELIKAQKSCFYIKKMLISIIQKYCSKPQNTLENLKNFQKEYKIPIEILHMDSDINSVFVNLTKIASTSTGKKFQVVTQVLFNMLRYCPWYVVSVLNLPTFINQKIESFLSWLIKSQHKKSSLLLNSMLSLITKFSEEAANNDLKQYLQQCIYFSVLDAILNVLSECTNQENWHKDLKNVDKIIFLVQLYVTIQRRFLIKSQIQQNDEMQGIQKVSQNLLELMSFILKNCQFLLQSTQRCCGIYWSIIQMTRGSSINEWYQQMTLNLVFSVFSSDSLSFSDNFRGITLISGSKNYMTSKQPNPVNIENQRNSQSQRYNFSQIKQFFDSNYQSLRENGSQNDNLDNLLIEYYKILESPAKNNIPIKIPHINLTNFKGSIPTLSEQTIESIYFAYCNGSDESKKMAKFCLSFLKLNSQNHKLLWKMVKNNEKSQFLTQLMFTRETIGQIFEIVKTIQKIVPEQNSQNRIIQAMLNLQLFSQNINHLEIFSSSFYFDLSKIDSFLKRKQLLWIFIVGNNSNWRQFNETFSTYLKNQNFMSTLLQYKEFLIITRKSSSDYEQKINQFAQILNQYQFYIQKKIDIIHLLKSTDSKQENEIRKSTLLLNVKISLIKCQFQKIIERMGNVGKLMAESSLENTSFQNLISSIHSLNSICNILAQGNVKLPAFSYHNKYQTQNCQSKQFLLGQWLEDVEKAYGKLIGKEYIPQTSIFTIKNDMQEFILEKQDSSQEVALTILDLNINAEKESVRSQYTKLKDSLKQFLTPSESHLIQFSEKQQMQINKSIVNRCYKMGHLFFWLNLQQNKPREQIYKNLSPLIQSFISRETLELQIIKVMDSLSYHHLKLIFIDEKGNGSVQKQLKSQSEEQPSTRQSLQEQKSPLKTELQENFFIWRDKQLIEGGKSIKVDQSNKKQYIELVCREILGNCNFILSKAFSLGYLNGALFSSE